MEKNMLAIDIGAGSGRFILGCWKDGELCLNEIGRFTHRSCTISGLIYWNLLEIYNEVLNGIRKACQAVDHLDSIGIDTFAPDFACFFKDRTLFGNVLSYQNFQKPEVLDELLQQRSAADFWETSGNAPASFFLLPQIRYLQAHARCDADADVWVMPLGNALAYMLCGIPHIDQTQVSISLLNDRHTGGWSAEAVLSFVQKPFRLPEIIPCETVLGRVNVPGLDCDAEVVNVGSHDTACANSRIAAAAGTELAVNAGTWISVGTATGSAVVNDSIVASGMNNYGLPNGSNLVCKLFIGMGLIRKLMTFAKENRFAEDYAALGRLAESSAYRERFSLFEPDLFREDIPFPDVVREIQKNDGRSAPDSFADVVRCVYESLTAQIVKIAGKVAECTDRRFSKIYLGGGGVQDAFFLNMLAEKSGMEIIPMPSESTAIGNLCAQLKAMNIPCDNT